MGVYQIPELLNVYHAVDVLNRALEKDPQTVQLLIDTRLPCNEFIAHDPTIQVGKSKDGETYTLGLLGIINGIFGTHPNSTQGWIGAQYDIETMKISKFVVLQPE